MDSKDVQTRKMRTVRINYYESNEWENIQIEFDNGHQVEISRLQVEAFLRINKVAQDLQAIQTLRDDLVKIFGKGPIAPQPHQEES